jgi:hypothetical protein
MLKVPILLLASFPKLVRLFFFKVFSPLVIMLSFFLLVSWGWLRAQFNSILTLFEFHFMCRCLFHRIPQAIEDEVRQTFHLPLNRITRNSTDELTWFLFSYCPVHVHVILEKVIQINKMFLLTSGGLWWVTGLLYKRSFHIPFVHRLLTIHGKTLRLLIFTSV